MSAGGALFALSAAQAVSQISQGYAQNAEAKLNASLLQGKASLLDVQSGIEQGQYQRLKGQTMGKSVAAAAGMGVGFSGSPMAAMLNAQTQINIDQAIAKFNMDQQKAYTLAEADQVRRQGKAAVRAGYSSAFSTILSGASNYVKYTSAGTPKDTTFDSVAAKKYAPGLSWNARY